MQLRRIFKKLKFKIKNAIIWKKEARKIINQTIALGYVPGSKDETIPGDIFNRSANEDWYCDLSLEERRYLGELEALLRKQVENKTLGTSQGRFDLEVLRANAPTCYLNRTIEPVAEFPPM